MNSFYGGGGVEMARVGGIRVGTVTSGQMNVAKRLSGSNAPPASTFHGSQSGATSPGPSNPAGCHLYEAYAREQCADGAPALITCYAERRG